jgi:hypothetical protein
VNVPELYANIDHSDFVLRRFNVGLRTDVANKARHAKKLNDCH